MEAAGTYGYFNTGYKKVRNVPYLKSFEVVGAAGDSGIYNNLSLRCYPGLV